MQVGETEAFCQELLNQLGTIIQDLQTHQIHLFFEAVGLRATLDCHDVVGGTATGRVREALRMAQERFAVVADGVMAPRDADLGEDPVAAFLGDQHGGNPGRIRLKRQEQHVEHELDVLAGVCRNARRRVQLEVGHRHPLGAFDALFDFADAGEILVELLPVVPVICALMALASSMTKSRMERSSTWRRLRFWMRWPGEPAPNKRSKTRRGLASGARGWVGLRQAMLYS